MDKIKCSKCDGTGKTKCRSCDGTGKTKCKTCSGTGEVRCDSCHGVGHVACPTCGGKGKKYVKCPSCHDGYNIDPDDDRKMKCAKCNGTGKIESGDCADCKGTGKVSCKVCSGNGKVKCADCKGTGSSPCKYCEGEGSFTCEECHGVGGFSVEEYCKTKILPDGDIDSVDEDVLKAIAHAADEGSGAAAYYISRTKTTCVDEWNEDGLRYLRESAKRNFAYGDFELGRYLCRQDDTDGLALLQKAADQGCGPALGLLAMIYYFGKCHQKKDVARAVGYCKRFTGKVDPFGAETETWGIAQFMRSLPEAEQGDVEHKRLLAFGAYFEGYKKEGIAILKELVASKDDLEAIEEMIGEIDGYCGDEEIVAYKREFAEYKKKVDAAVRKTKDKSQKAKENQDSKPTEKDIEKTHTENGQTNCSPKKRWKFITLGLLLGWMGAHYMYAKRIVLLALLWVSFIAGVAMIGSNGAIGGGCIALWVLLWLGGTFFVKKDGKGNRM